MKTKNKIKIIINLEKEMHFKYIITAQVFQIIDVKNENKL